jgi:hypothetical protein
MLELSLGGGQSLANLAQAVGATQLTEQHGHELAPTGKPTSVALGLGLIFFIRLGSLGDIPESTAR